MTLKLAASGGWRPIEDAPKDGTWIVGFCGGEPRHTYGSIYIVMRWWDGIFPPDDDDLSCSEGGEWTCEGDGRTDVVTHWLPFAPHPNAPPKTTAMDNFHGPGTYPTRSDRGITQEEIDATRAAYAEYERTGEMPREWLADQDESSSGAA